ncbi:MAG TPA: hypothetical protein VI911_12020 [Patescibacteria group bacterium]|nr:hypothetical protein [Patescibacteria group bacterium]
MKTGGKQKIQTAIETPFDNSTNGMESDNVQDAIEEASIDNFSYDVVDEDSIITIPAGQQMIVDEAIDIEGVLDIEGKCVILGE